MGLLSSLARFSMGATLGVLSIVAFPSPNDALFAQGGTYQHLSQSLALFSVSSNDLLAGAKHQTQAFEDSRANSSPSQVIRDHDSYAPSVLLCTLPSIVNSIVSVFDSSPRVCVRVSLNAGSTCSITNTDLVGYALSSLLFSGLNTQVPEKSGLDSSPAVTTTATKMHSAEIPSDFTAFLPLPDAPCPRVVGPMVRITLVCVMRLS